MCYDKYVHHWTWCSKSQHNFPLHSLLIIDICLNSNNGNVQFSVIALYGHGYWPRFILNSCEVSTLNL